MKLLLLSAVLAWSCALCVAFTEALIDYALGRPFGFRDEDLTTSIVQRARGKDFPLGEFIHTLVTSESFHSK